MTKKEAAEIFTILQSNYRDFSRNWSDTVINAKINLWFMQFRDDDYKEVLTAVMAYIATDTSRDMPPVGAIKAKLVEIRNPNEMTELEAWGLVQKALRNGYYGAQEEFDKLPPVVQRLVGSPNQLREWALMDTETISSVVASNFQRSYKVRAAKEREFLALPTAVQQTMTQIADRMKMPELPSEAEFEQRRQEQIRRLSESCVKEN